MHIPAASLTLSATVAFCLVGALGNGTVARAEPIAIVIADAAPDTLLGAVNWSPQTLQRDADSAAADTGTDRAAGAPPQLDIGESPTPSNRHASAPSLQPSLAPSLPTIESSLAPAVTATTHDDWTWDREFKETIRPFYEELADSGLIDAVGDFKSYLVLSAPPAFDAPSSTGYGATHDAASWAADAHPHSPVLLEKDRLIAAMLLDEMIAAIKPWLFVLAGLFVLWHLVRLSIDYSRWKTARAHKRGSRKTRRRRTPAVRSERGS